MALQNYITSASMTHVHIVQFPPSIIQPYIDESNDWLEDLGSQMGVRPEDIKTPVGIIIDRALTSYVNMRFAMDSIGSNNPEISSEDMYRVMYNDWQKIYQDLEKQITPELLMQTANNSPKARSVSTGTLFRRA